VSEVFITGLAYDICVLNTAISAFKLGYTTFLVEDAGKAIAPETATEKCKAAFEAALAENPALDREKFRIIKSIDVV
jgi:nicotinamidase/pyrazinamidase